MKACKRFLLASFCTSLCLSTSALGAVKQILVFGDSLSDDGNLYHLSYSYHSVLDKIPAIINDYPNGYIPSRYNNPYYGGRFSNGKTWVEDIANLFHIRDTNSHRDGLFIDYAYGGAHAASFEPSNKLPTPTVFPPNLSMQVATYDALHLLKSKQADTLAIIMTGANDYLGGRSDTDTATTSAVNAISSAIDHLYHHGVHQFLIAGLPDLGLTYDSYRHGSAFAKHETELSTLHNQKLAQVVQAYQANTRKYPDMKITFFNWTPFHRAAIENYQAMGFDYANSQPCHPGANIPTTGSVADNPQLAITASVASQTRNHIPSECDADASEPSKHIYMDPVHPTRVVHCMLALTACHLMEGSNGEVNCHISDTQDPTQVATEAAKVCWGYEAKGWLKADTPIEN